MTDISPTTNGREIRATRAFELENKLKTTKTNIGSGFLEIGKILKEVRDNQYYTELGYQSVAEWFSSPDVSISPSWAWHFISIYETFVLKHKITIERLSGIDYTKLQDITKVVGEHPEQVDEWIEKARSLRRIDLKRELQELRVQTNLEEYKKTIPTKTTAVAQTYKSGDLQLAESWIAVGDWLENMRRITKESVDCIITTPPILVTKEEASLRDESEKFTVVDDYSKARGFYYDMLTEMDRVLTNDRSIFIFGNLHNIFTIGDILKDMKYTILRDIIWFKQRVDVHYNPFNLIKSHETILWARKGSTHTNNITDVEKDVWEISKKRAIIDKLVNISTYPKQLVFDPFLEDETLMDYVNMLDRRFIGIKRATG